MKLFLAMLGAVCVCAACDREPAGAGSAELDPPTVTSHGQESAPAVRDNPRAASDEARPARARGWEIEISGVDLPAVSGGSVMAMNMPGGIATYRFANADLMGSIDLQGTRVGEAGVFVPYNLQFNFLQQQWTCGMSALNPGEDLKVDIKSTASGYRGTISGEVECTPAGGGERKGARVEGWFEK